jgi:hypothetical protein
VLLAGQVRKNIALRRGYLVSAGPNGEHAAASKRMCVCTHTAVCVTQSCASELNCSVYK